MRITRVYTKSGDQGDTSLVDGSRVSKADLRVASYGDVDELNSVLGLARVGLTDAQLDAVLGRIQNELFVLGADLASPAHIAVPRVNEALVVALEHDIDLLNAELEPLREFVLPGGNQLAATLHLARTVARRAERTVVALATGTEITDAAIRYLNRLSDLLFVMARVANKRSGTAEPAANFSQRK
ncbi:MAG: cob(I)yrinic acid a,c-diamide adenosyltransferase [Acidobacteria bacterium]|nr:cob(I)yrinic acid a,c-diamide adenosyltransferase [Acidobacteriota bacterium]MBI3422436.1 cob(I)yrinic acid a,c-diamide adenosyltransferase [Acidobacteriota bacterium]